MYPTFLSVVTECLNRARLLSNSTYLGPLQNAVNAVNKEILTKKEWPFLAKTGRVNTSPPVVSGSVSGTQGQNTVQGVGTAFALSMEGWYVRIGMGITLYEITGVDVANQILTLASPLVDQTFNDQIPTLFPYSYAFPTDFQIPEDMKSFQIEPNLRHVGVREYRGMFSTYISGPPRYWAIDYRESNPQVPQLVLYPFPDQAYALHFDYQQLVPDLVNNSDPILIPDPFRRALVEGAMAILYRDVLDRPDRAAVSENQKDRIVAEMANSLMPLDDQPEFVPITKNYRSIGFAGRDGDVVSRMTWRY